MESPISTRAAILQALAVESCHGSAVISRMQEQTDDKLVLHSGSLYPALVGLENEGLIKKRRVVDSDDSKVGRPPTAYYELTRKGREIVHEHRTIVLAVFFPGDVIKEYAEWLVGSSSTSTAS
jgi:DNA-binding PadR family transcriptional regulator